MHVFKNNLVQLHGCDLASTCGILYLHVFLFHDYGSADLNIPHMCILHMSGWFMFVYTIQVHVHEVH